MDISSIDITLGRIQSIESRIQQLDRNISRLTGEEEQSFEDVLTKKLKEGKAEFSVPEFTSEETGISGEKTSKSEIRKLIEKYAKKNGLNTDLVNAVVKQESGFNPNAISRAGAQGLMQLMPGTAAGLGVDNPLDPEENIAGGTKYLSNLINKYNSVEMGLAAYNAGPNSVDKYGGVPPYAETQNYVKNIMQMQGDNNGSGN